MYERIANDCTFSGHAERKSKYRHSMEPARTLIALPQGRTGRAKLPRETDRAGRQRRHTQRETGSRRKKPLSTCVDSSNRKHSKFDREPIAIITATKVAVALPV
jgi:hypothetical protein